MEPDKTISNFLNVDGILEETVSFLSENNQLIGTLTMPADLPQAKRSDTAIVFSHGWSGTRGGPQNMFIRLARKFTQEFNLPCLRFDFAGRGESAGNGLEANLATMASDLKAAVDFAQRKTGCKKIIACGICSGGNVAIGALSNVSAVKAMMLFSVYPFSDGDNFGRDINRTFHHAGTYLRKAIQLNTWKRFFRGEIDFSGVSSVLFGHFRKSKSKEQTSEKKSEPKTKAIGKTSKAAKIESRAGGKAPTKYLDKLRPEVPILMIYGSRDPDATAAHKYFGKYMQKIPIEIHTIENATHNFPNPLWELQLQNFCREFLKNKLTKSAIN